MKREGVRIIEADGTVTFENGAPESVEKNRF